MIHLRFHISSRLDAMYDAQFKFHWARFKMAQLKRLRRVLRDYYCKLQNS